MTQLNMDLQTVNQRKKELEDDLKESMEKVSFFSIQLLASVVFNIWALNLKKYLFHVPNVNSKFFLSLSQMSLTQELLNNTQNELCEERNINSDLKKLIEEKECSRDQEVQVIIIVHQHFFCLFLFCFIFVLFFWMRLLTASSFFNF